MRNTMKVARWEIKRNLKNKSFMIGMFLTPALFLGFFFISSLFNSDDYESEPTTVFVNDQLDIFEDLQKAAEENELNLELHRTDLNEEMIEDELTNNENTAYIFVDSRAMDDGIVPVYTSETIDDWFSYEIQFLEEPIRARQIEKIGLSAEEVAIVVQGIVFEEATAEDIIAMGDLSEDLTEDAAGPGFDQMERIVPGAFAGIILLSIVFTGMMIFQSASQEKKDKIAEIILSSLTPGELMQGKIVGYFVLGIIQAVVFIGCLLPVAVWKIDMPIMEYLFVPELILLIAIAIIGYLLFASMFVGIGSTMADITTAGNFQGMLLMLPFLPFIFIGPVISDPSGLIAQIGTYIPFTAPGILLLRLSLLETWPWVEIIISLAILIVSVWVFMKLAGRIFKTGILMYGKNATPKEIWKWMFVDFKN